MSVIGINNETSRKAAFDFPMRVTSGVTIRGVAFPHLLFEALVGRAAGGLQGALWMLGAVPALLRHDNLSAATHELERSGGRQLTARFRQVLDHYRLGSSRIQPGKAHERGGRAVSPSRRWPSSRRCCCGATETSTTSRPTCASYERSSTRSGTGRRRLGWPSNKPGRVIALRGGARKDVAGQLGGWPAVSTGAAVGVKTANNL